MPPPAYFGIESSGLSLAVDLLILFVVVLYLALIYWTYADAKRRIEDPVMVWCAAAASVFPFVGTVIYMILRPPEYLEDVRERELEMQAAEARLHQLEHSVCPYCDHPVERDFIRCPSCLRKIRERCTGCERPLEQTWTICPYCETDVPGLAASKRGTRRRRQAAPAALEPELPDIATAVATEDPEPESAPVAAEPLPRARSTSRARRPRPGA
jgi:heme exporter protein D